EKSVFLCLGVQTKTPLDGEETFLGRGVSYCATCDGNLYKGKTIAVLATDKSFEHEIEYLCSLAGKVYVMPMYKGYEITAENAEIVMKSPLKITGGMRAEEVIFKDANLKVDGIFILRDSISPATLVHGLKTEEGHISVNRRMETNIKGIFAAGDCTGKPYQYVKAAGEGNTAMHYAVEYLAGLKK
ncbi:MAG: FAD-dependent oxidoreductase, partial [Clostridia bacterium]|nr:FAD-dependent oxidoreductase [Clostridia bacterium]